MDIIAGARRLFHSHFLLPLLIPPLSSIVLVALFNTLLTNFFQVELRGSGLLADAVAGTLLAYWLYFLLRPLWLFLTVQALLIGLLYVSNGLKLDFFSAPVLPSDLQTLPALLAESSGWRFLSMITPFIVLSALFLVGLRWRWQTPVLLLGGIALFAGALWLAPTTISRDLDARFAYKPFDVWDNFKARGPILFLVNEYARARDVAGRTPTQAEVNAALQASRLPQPLPAPSVVAPRDVYVFMMETLWDPSLLKSVHFTRDPLAPGFRMLWEQSGESKVLVPVFGGGTPNTEFEVLCGMPAYDGPIIFVTTLHRPVECLPRILDSVGYRTDAATPDEYGLWNRGAAFRLLGFQRFYDADNFDESDRNGAFMADSPLFAQVDALLAKENAPQPKLVYISTDSGHYPFELDPTLRPALVHADSQDPLLTAYANAVHYDTGELADYIARIRARDPDAVILAFGDHLPVLGRGLRDYKSSGLIARRERDVTPQMVTAVQSTPLLLIDGRRGPVKLTHVSAFELPRLVLSLLGVKQPTLSDALAPPAHVHPRPIGGRLLQVTDDGGMDFCAADETPAGCQETLRWFDRMQILRADILAGSDYTETALYGTSMNQAPPEAGLSYLYHGYDARPCDVKVRSWGPSETRFGRGVNKNDETGNTVFYISYQGSATHLRVWLGSEELEVNAARNGIVTAALTGSLPLYLPGEHDLTLACNGDPARIKVGEFHVRL